MILLVNNFQGALTHCLGMTWGWGNKSYQGTVQSEEKQNETPDFSKDSVPNSNSTWQKPAALRNNSNYNYSGNVNKNGWNNLKPIENEKKSDPYGFSSNAKSWGSKTQTNTWGQKNSDNKPNNSWGQKSNQTPNNQQSGSTWNQNTWQSKNAPQNNWSKPESSTWNQTSSWKPATGDNNQGWQAMSQDSSNNSANNHTKDNTNWKTANPDRAINNLHNWNQGANSNVDSSKTTRQASRWGGPAQNNHEQQPENQWQNQNNYSSNTEESNTQNQWHQDEQGYWFCYGDDGSKWYQDEQGNWYQPQTEGTWNASQHDNTNWQKEAEKWGTQNQGYTDFTKANNAIPSQEPRKVDQIHNPFTGQIEKLSEKIATPEVSRDRSQSPERKRTSYEREKSPEPKKSREDFAQPPTPPSPVKIPDEIFKVLDDMVANNNIPQWICNEAQKLQVEGPEKLPLSKLTALAKSLDTLSKNQQFHALAAGDQMKHWSFVQGYDMIKTDGEENFNNYAVKPDRDTLLRNIPEWVHSEIKKEQQQRMYKSKEDTTPQFSQWLIDHGADPWFQCLNERQQRQIWNLAQKKIAMEEYAKQKFNSLRDTVFKSGVPVALISMDIQARQQRFAKCYAKLSLRYDSYKQLMFDYDALCFIPDRNKRIMNRLGIVRKNLYEKFDQMKRVALQMAYINKINELLTPFEADESSLMLEATVLKELLAWSAIILKDATWSSFAEDALTTLITDIDKDFKTPEVVLKATDNSGYFKAAEFQEINDDEEIVEKIKKTNQDQEAYGFPPPGVKRGGDAYYGFTAKIGEGLKLFRKSNKIFSIMLKI